MTATTLQRGKGRSPSATPDLRESLGEQILLKLALDAVQSLDPSSLNGAVVRTGKFRPQMLLTLLGYCYAARIYGSRDIEWAIRHDKTVRYICARTFPDWQAIRRFRRDNRQLVEQCLRYVLTKGRLLHSDEPEGEWSPKDLGLMDLRQQVVSEVQSKIEVAIVLDMAEYD